VTTKSLTHFYQRCPPCKVQRYGAYKNKEHMAKKIYDRDSFATTNRLGRRLNYCIYFALLLVFYTTKKEFFFKKKPSFNFLSFFLPIRRISIWLHQKDSMHIRKLFPAFSFFSDLHIGHDLKFYSVNDLHAYLILSTSHLHVNL
jgi:hypothetical protein